jgi:hypothetical protein
LRKRKCSLEQECERNFSVLWLFVGNVASYLNFPDRMVLALPLSELAKFLVFFLSLALKQIEATCVQNGPVEFEKKY